MQARLRSNKEEPRCEKSNTAIAGPRRPRLRRDRLEPRTAKSKTDRKGPRRVKLCTDEEIPKCAKSNTDKKNTESMRAKPKTDINDPRRAKDCNEGEEPGCKKSSTDGDDSDWQEVCVDNEEPGWIMSSTSNVRPIHARPKGKNAASKRENKCNDKENLRCKRSKTNNKLPNRAKLCADRGAPGWVKSIIESEETDPKRATPNSKEEKPRRAKLLKGNEGSRCKESGADIEDSRRKELRTDENEPI